MSLQGWAKTRLRSSKTCFRRARPKRRPLDQWGQSGGQVIIWRGAYSPETRCFSYETGAQGGIRTHTPDKGKRILSPPRLPFRHLGRCIGLFFALLDLCANQQRQAPHQYYTDTSKAGSNSPGSRTVALCSSVPPFQQPASRTIT